MQRITCESCSSKLKVADKYSGRRIKCPKCKTAIAVPERIEEETIDWTCPRCHQSSAVPTIPVRWCAACEGSEIGKEEERPSEPASQKEGPGKPDPAEGLPIPAVHFGDDGEALCPECGGREFNRLKPREFIAYAKDYRCVACKTLFEAPTPLWASLLFFSIGLLLSLAGSIGCLLMMGTRHKEHKLILVCGGLAVLGIFSVVKAATDFQKRRAARSK